MEIAANPSMAESDLSCQGEGCALARGGPSFDVLNQLTGVRCRSIQELSLLFAVSQTLERSFDLGVIMRPVLTRMRDLMGMERGTITIINRDTGDFMISEAVGMPRGVDPKMYLQLIEKQLARTVAKLEPVVLPNLQLWASGEGIDNALLQKLNITGKTGLIIVPLKFEDTAIGTLSIESQRDPMYGWEADLRVLTMIASIISQAAKVRQDTAEQIQSLRAENNRLQEQIAQGFRPASMVGTSSSMRTVYYHIDQVATSLTTVLIRGESGTGKELVAKAIHQKSNRTTRAFVKFNCAALPDSIIESELFGHEKGAFTGALAMRKGRFEAADGGTIFLDEIGDV